MCFAHNSIFLRTAIAQLDAGGGARSCLNLMLQALLTLLGNTYGGVDGIWMGKGSGQREGRGNCDCFP